LDQRGHTRRMAEARAVIDVVRAEAGADQFLEQIRLFVRSLCGAETRERAFPVSIANITKTARRQLECLFPSRFAKHLVPLLRIDDEVLVLRHTGLADQRPGEAMAMLDVVESVTTLDAEPARVGGPILSLHEQNAVVLDVIRQLATDAAVRA